MFKRYAALRLSAALLVAVAAPASGGPGPREREPSTEAASQQPASQHGPCVGPFDAVAVVRCALSRSPELRLAKQELEVVAGQRVSAGTLLPSHPVVTASVADRRLFPGAPQEPQAPVLNWYVTLAQEIEIAGQRGARIREVEAEQGVQLRRVAVAEQEASASALSAYYEALAANEEVRLTADIARIADALATASAARARESLLAPVDADVARSEAVRIALGRFEAERRYAAAQAVLASLLGLQGPLALTGSLDQALPTTAAPVESIEQMIRSALAVRGEVAAAEQEHRMRLAHVSLLRRQRVPNPTLSLFAQRDGFNERVLGGGISMPLFLPGPLGPSRAGEISSALAQVEQADTTLEQVRRRVRMEVTRAVQAEQVYALEVQLFPADLTTRARADLQAIGQALSARQLPIREALLSQRSLIELLQSHIRSRLAFALARVERMRAAGQPLAGGTP
jgi:cobalt-zinc-cadmium efflux system outer membrane protein